MKTPLLFTLILAAAIAPLAQAGNPAPKSEATAQATPVAIKELKIIDLAPGTGSEAQSGHPVWVQYTGWLYDAAAPEHKGKKFDSSEGRVTPFGFFLGVGKVIKGWDQGVPGMKIGGKRRLIIPAELAYGEKGAGGVIPPNAALVFDIELVDVK